MDSLNISLDFDSFVECSSRIVSSEDLLQSDDDTVIAEQGQAWTEDINDVKRLIITGDKNLVCPGCNFFFDDKKRRRLIDNCGHEVCYVCMFNNEKCILCTKTEEHEGPINKNTQRNIELSLPNKANASKIKIERKSQFFDEKTIADVKNISKCKMTQSCPGTSQSKRKFIFSPKSKRKQLPSNKPNSNGKTQSQGIMSLSTNAADTRSWSNIVLSKIRSLWSSSSSNTNVGLNQLLLDNENCQVKRKVVEQKNMCMRYEGLSKSCIPTDTFQLLDKNSKSLTTSPSRSLTASYCDLSTSLTLDKSFSKADSLNSSGYFKVSRPASFLEDGFYNYPILMENDNKQLDRFKNRSNWKPLKLKPLFFEVPTNEVEPIFSRRNWLFSKLVDFINGDEKGVLLTGKPGVGKTTIILQLVEYSCFGRNRTTNNNIEKYVASHVCAYHFCQADYNVTCLVPDFIHSIAAQMCQAVQLVAYKEFLLVNPQIQSILSLEECISNPNHAFEKGIIEPLVNLKKIGKIKTSCCLILVDALCEAEYHKPDFGDTITSFLAKHLKNIPPWIKFVASVRTQLIFICKEFSFDTISLDYIENTLVKDDLLKYIETKLNGSADLCKKIKMHEKYNESFSQQKIWKYLINLSEGSYLFIKLSLDLLEKGLADVTSFKEDIPKSLEQIYLLNFNSLFKDNDAFKCVEPILSICLSSLYPLTQLEIYETYKSMFIHDSPTWEEFQKLFNLVNSYLLKRSDQTYMFFHPSLREWLIRREDNDSKLYLCDLRIGHSSISFRLSRMEVCLDPDKTIELTHHILKCNIYKNIHVFGMSSKDLQCIWLSDCSDNISATFAHIRNLYNPNIRLSKFLLLSGASPNFYSSYLSKAPLICIYAYVGAANMVSLLIEYGANVDLTNQLGQSALMLAAMKGHHDIVKSLIIIGANLCLIDTSGYCALTYAANGGHIHVVNLLLSYTWIAQQPADIQIKHAIENALITAINSKHVNMVHYLLNVDDIDINFVDSLTGENMLSASILSRNEELSSDLLKMGIHLSIKNRNNLTPLLLAIKERQRHIMELLFKYNVNMEEADINGLTPLMYASMEGAVEILVSLLSKGVNMEAEDGSGLTALCWACLKSQAAAVTTLIKAGANVSHVDKIGRTPLDYASCQHNINIIQMLLEHGANLEHIDSKGMRALDRAVGLGNVSVVKHFLKIGSKLGSATWALAQSKPDVMVILLNKMLEDGNYLYHQNKITDACNRYVFSLKKLSSLQTEKTLAQQQLEINLLLNYCRCKRKLGEIDEALNLANQIIKMKPNSYEAYYTRAKTKVNIGNYTDALEDIEKAIEYAPAQHAEIQETLRYLKKQILKNVLQN